MAKKKVTTKSTKRYTYSSFRDRIEDLKINRPLLRTSKRDLDVEVSNFYERYEHWKEINITGNFIEFLDKTEPLFQTLPQLIYHRNKIYNELILSLTKEDNIELTFEPLLDLLSQFAHDLGEDFYNEFYEKTVVTLTDLAIKQYENSNVLEWIFNSLGFIFKYLASILSKDLIETFRLLLPLFKFNKRGSYLARFASEALSFLVKKVSIQNLPLFVSQTVDLLDENPSIAEALITMYAESMTNVSGTLHSRAELLLETLLELATRSPGSNALASDVILKLLGHGEEEASKKVYMTVLKMINGRLQTELTSKLLVQLLVLLGFAQSGRKISDWPAYLDTVQKCFEKAEGDNVDVNNSFVQLGAIIIRNCDLPELTKFHVKLFQYMSSLNQGKHFLPFVELSMNLNSERTISFGSKFVQDYFNTSWESSIREIALFLSHMSLQNLVSRLNLVIPFGAVQSVQESLHELKNLQEPESLKEIHWRLLILRHSTNVNNANDLIRILNSIIANKKIDCPFLHDIVGLILQSLAVQETVELSAVISSIHQNLANFRDSLSFLTGVLRYVESLTTTEYLSENLDDFLTLVSDGLKSSSHEIRYVSLSVIIASLKKTGNEVPSLINQCQIIEDIPLTLQTARDIQLRTRNVGSEFAKTNINSLTAEVVPKYLFGLLTVLFSPSWEGSYDAMNMIAGKVDEKLWQLAYEFIVKDYAAEESDSLYFKEASEGNKTSSISEWLVKDGRLNDNTNASYSYIDSYADIDESVVKFAEQNRADIKYRRSMRTQALNALVKNPEIAEAHSLPLVNLLLNEEIEQSDATEDEEDNVNSYFWSFKERSLLVTVFEKFRSMKKLEKRDQVYTYMLHLLSNRLSLVLKSALNCIFNFKNPHINKYRDNFGNLLDETLFRDELTKFVASDSTTNIIEDEDRDEVMRLVLRILFGRSQTPKSSGTNKGKKFASISVLPSLPAQYIADFIRLGTERIPFEEFFSSGAIDPKDITEKTIRREVGLVNLLSDVIGVLGSGFNEVLSIAVEPLTYLLASAQYAISNKEQLPTEIMEKSARAVRTTGMRCLNELFQNMKDIYNWVDHIGVIYEHILAPRFENFAEENLQQPSSLLKMLVSWSFTKSLQNLLYFEDYRPVRELLSLLANENAKELVLSTVLDFCLSMCSTTSLDEKFIEAVSIVVEECLLSLASMIERITNKDVNSKAISLLLSLSENGYIEDYETKKSLINSLVNAFDKSSQQVEMKDKISILKALATLVQGFDCSLDEILPVYNACSKAFKNYSDKKVRQTMCEVFVNIGDRFIQFERVGKYLSDLNSFSPDRMNEPDFGRRLGAFKDINESTYATLDSASWLPLIYCALFFMNDKEELGLRTNATYMLRRFIDCYSSKSSESEAEPYIKQLKNIILPLLRLGLRSDEEVVQSEYISLLAHIVEASKYYTELEDMKVLLIGGDEEANIFSNVNHIQLHRRQRAIRRLRQFQNDLTDSSVSHYILPMIENYVFSDDEKLLNVGNDTIETIGVLSASMSWNQFKALMKRYISYLSSPRKPLKSSVQLVVCLASALSSRVQTLRETLVPDKNLPSESDIQIYITNEVLPQLMKIISKRDDETIVLRIPISEAQVSLIMCLDAEVTTNELPGVLTSVCQVMRSRSEELRDAVRKNLSKMAQILGSAYFKFILLELKTALKRGSQIHVLSFTIHHLLVTMSGLLTNGDLNECAELLVDVIMEDLFGAAGQEKDAEGYTSKMKEVKHNKSYDTAEILASKISLSSFSHLISPIKMLLMEKIQSKTQNKLEELLRRYALGLHHNEESSSREILVLCYQLHEQSRELLAASQRSKPKVKDTNADHFIVKLDARSLKTETEYSLYLGVLQKFALELLRVAISRNELLATTANLEGFVPLLEESLNTENEGVVISAIKVLNSIVKLPFSEEIDNTFKSCARKALNILKDSPSTSSDLAQACLRFLATVIRHKPDIKLKDTALSYILTKIRPDLSEPNKQGLAFNFLKSLVASHIMISEIYDTMDKVAETMVTNHSKEIRDMSRSVYYQFLMEYDQSRGRLEKQFKFLVNNLQYPAEKGRQSVMELLHLVINKAGTELLSQLSSSFFVSLTMVMISDDSNRCREMAVVLLSSILKKQGDLAVKSQEVYISSWLGQRANSLLSRCGLQTYKLIVSEVGLGADEKLDLLAMDSIRATLELAKKAENKDDVEWELVYSSLTVLATVFGKLGDSVFQREYKSLWLDVVDALLYPHSWVRLSASRLIGIYVSKLDEMNLTDYEIQTIAYRLLRQLAAPGISELLGSQIVKNMAKITMYWSSKQTPYVDSTSTPDDSNYQLASEWAISRTSAILRNEIGENLLTNKKSSIQYVALLIQILSVDEVFKVAETIILPLYNYTESNNDNDEELKTLSLETMEMLESKLGVTKYTEKFTKVRQLVTRRRQERKAKRSQLALTAPDISAKRKMRKHERFREKRKHEKDENGYYREKRKKIDRVSK